MALPVDAPSWMRWRGRIVLVVLLLAAGAMFVPAVRREILRVPGWAVIAKDRLEPADLIVVMLDTDGAGAIQASDLVRNGVAVRVAVFADPPDSIDLEFLRRGVPYEDMAAREIRQLKAVGVEKVERIPKPTSEAKNGPILANWCVQYQVHSVIVVTNLNESRLIRREFHRSLKSHHIKVMICSAPYADFDPDGWWKTHGGIRTEIEQLESLLLDLVRHPIS